ncbi:hypothetical protein V2J09_023805 [Rumex salicifolius]
MAIRRHLAKRLLPLSSSNASRSVSRRHYVSPPDAASRGFFRRFLQRRAINQASMSPAVRIPPFMAFPTGADLREKLRGTTKTTTIENARRILRLAQVETVKERLRSEEKSTVAYAEFVRICVDACRSETQGVEIAKLLDESANVVVWGSVVFLHPQQLAKSMETLLWQAVGLPNDPRKKELEEMEKQKAQIDAKAQLLVRRELYCGLGLMLAQTVGFMRLTFWELSWDVMEPICFFVTSLYCAVGYGFFLRTSTEPSYEGYFKRRFMVKQAKLMREGGFDLDKYERLCEVFYMPTRGFNYHVEKGFGELINDYSRIGSLISSVGGTKRDQVIRGRAGARARPVILYAMGHALLKIFEYSVGEQVSGVECSPVQQYSGVLNAAQALLQAATPPVAGSVTFSSAGHLSFRSATHPAYRHWPVPPDGLTPMPTLYPSTRLTSPPLPPIVNSTSDAGGNPPPPLHFSPPQSPVVQFPAPVPSKVQPVRGQNLPDQPGETANWTEAPEGKTNPPSPRRAEPAAERDPGQTV